MSEQLYRCYRCKSMKPASEFHRCSGRANGLQCRCKGCNRELNKEYAAKHPDYFRQKNNESYHRQDNKTRYQKYKAKFISESRAFRLTPRGRLGLLLASARRRARTKGIAFALTLDWLAAAYEAQSGRCLLTGISFEFAAASDAGLRLHPYSPSLDRISRSEGYTPENVRLVCTAINLALNEFGEEVLARVARAFLEKRAATGQAV